MINGFRNISARAQCGGLARAMDPTAAVAVVAASALGLHLFAHTPVACLRHRFTLAHFTRAFIILTQRTNCPCAAAACLRFCSSQLKRDSGPQKAQLSQAKDSIEPKPSECRSAMSHTIEQKPKSFKADLANDIKSQKPTLLKLASQHNYDNLNF